MKYHIFIMFHNRNKHYFSQQLMNQLIDDSPNEDKEDVDKLRVASWTQGADWPHWDE